MKYEYIAFGATAITLIAYFIVRAKAAAIGRDLMPIGWPLLTLCLITIAGDNVMISSGLFDYGPDSLIGISIGLMPIEDLSYPVIAVLLAALLGPKRER